MLNINYCCTLQKLLFHNQLINVEKNIKKLKEGILFNNNLYKMIFPCAVVVDAKWEDTL